LDSEESAADQTAWLEGVLTDPAHAEARFIISFHRPLYPSVGGHSGWADGVSHWMPIFEAHAPRILVATGHNHGMARERVKGVEMVTSGGAGAPLYGCSQVHSGTRFCGYVYGYYACDASLTCLAWAVDVGDGSEVLIDAFHLQ